ncbi:probable cation-transporting ATPase 13A3 [Copidosoma floridanum]|uniref:probable cation-transporting ATPase 13A3 n=1 Tax=Copidosoma floridanum TaxID=29053 RepID=UPI0006C98D88|nr:probable cation-transporting ATPase 13A3 [Copidosoma floridanum]XP_014205362.1 probable cation-transporting ATPase 13A3 [Copidosoma floridanum]
MTSVNGVKDRKDTEVTAQIIKDSQDERMEAYGFEVHLIYTLLTFVACVLSLGSLRLFFHWYPHLYLYATHKKCDLGRATKILVVDDYQGKYKSYIVKEVKTVSTKNLSAKSLGRKFERSSAELVEKVRDGWLELNLENGSKRRVQEYRAFSCKKQCYVWDDKQAEFSKLASVERYALCVDLHAEKAKGLSREEQLLRRLMYGYNEILVPVQSFRVLFVLEILNPFYVFQAFSLVVWFNEGYVHYAVAVVLMSLFGILSSIRQTRANQISLRNTVASTERVRVLRSSGEYESISSDELVPGDIIELPRHRAVVACDAVLLTGSCIVNESMLTGESVPVTKTPLQSHAVLYDARGHSHHTLFCGTTIIQTKQYGDKPVLAKVIRTGLWTTKGSLVAAILYPPPTDFKFDQDSYKLVGILIGVAFLGFFYTLAVMIARGNTLTNILIKTLTVFTIVIPPALPSVMAVGKMYAIFRLKKRQIYCINTRAINISGSIDCVCFDKTGTLTEDGLDMMGVVVHEGNKLSQPEKDVTKLRDARIFKGMLVCHSLTIINDELSGDPLDVKMFESTGWELYEPELIADPIHRGSSLQALSIIRAPKSSKDNDDDDDDDGSMEILQQYQFSSTLQRMSVIARRPKDGRFVAYTKGSPEMILSMSLSRSVPADIMDTLRCFTEQGYRVIAVACKDIEAPDGQVQKIPREEVEKDLEFLGLIILENRLKSSTIKVIKDLREANIKTVMITGDNIQTAISVAKECGILSQSEIVVSVSVVPSDNKDRPEIYFNAQGALQLEKKLKPSSLDDLEFGGYSKNYKFALTGDTWQLLREHYNELLPRICTRGVVFARMSSDQKQQLVVELMQLGYHVAMCGDGANDCGALRAAHVGISLSEAESSVASPFTSRVPDITCVPTVIQQGRAALVTSFGIFKFTVCYSLTEFVSTIILYSISSNFTGLQFFYVDVFVFVNFAFFFGKTEAYEKLAKTPPTSSLVSFTPLFSITVHTIIIAMFQLIAFHVVQQFSWYKAMVWDDEYRYDCYENYSVFSLSTFQYIIIAIVFSMGKPYRLPIHTNKCLVLSIIVVTLANAYITLDPAKWTIDLLELQMPPVYDWRYAIIVLVLVNGLVSIWFESFVVEYLIQRKVGPRLYKPEKSKKEYVLVECELRREPDWPPISRELPSLPITPSYENIVNSERKASIADLDFVYVVNEDEKKACVGLKDGIDNPAFSSDVQDNEINQAY